MRVGVKGSAEEGVGGVVLSLSLRLSLLSLSLRLSLSLSLTWRKKMLEGWSGITTFFPMASASAVAVHRTSLVLGLTKTR